MRFWKLVENAPGIAETLIRLMQAMYQNNRRYGRGSLLLSSAGGIRPQPVWGMKQETLWKAFLNATLQERQVTSS